MSSSDKNDARINRRLPDRPKETIEQRDRTTLTNRDRDLFLALLENADAKPNRALAAAAQKYIERKK